MTPTKVSIALGIACIGLAIVTLPSQAVEEEKLESVEANFVYSNYGSADSLIELDPVYIDNRAVDVELFSAPNPRRRTEFTFEGPEDRDEGRGIEIIEFSLPVN